MKADDLSMANGGGLALATNLTVGLQAAAASSATEEAASSTREYLSHLDDVGSSIMHGEPITEKRSTFQVTRSSLIFSLPSGCLKYMETASCGDYGSRTEKSIICSSLQHELIILLM